MTNLVEKALSLGGGALAMTRDKATEIINGLVEKGEVKREEAQALIDDLVARGQESVPTCARTWPRKSRRSKPQRRRHRIS